MGIQINGATDTISASDGSLSVTSSESIFSGIATFSDGVNLTGPSLIAVNSSSNALRITQTGSGNVFLAEDQTNPDGSPFVITGSGSVGIGTTNPTATLHVDGDISATGDVSALTANITSLTASANSGFHVDGGAPANSFLLGNTGNLSLGNDFTVSGDVGVGTDNPIMRLHVHGAANSADSRIRLSSTEGSGLTIRAQSATENNINVDSGEFLSFTVANTEGFRMNSSGNIAFPSGKGIDFSANTATGTGTTTSSVLDDYERGTWTPSFVQLTTENNMYVDNGLTIYHADYTKIGTNVWISLYIKNDASFNYDTGRSGTDSLSIGGLPFAVSNTPVNSGYYPAFVGYFQSWTSWSESFTPMGYFVSGLNSIALTYAVANGTNNIQAQYMYASNSSIILSGWYQTDS